MTDFHGIPADTDSDHGGFDLAIPKQWRPVRSHEGHRICNTSIQWVTAKKNPLTMTGHPPSVITAAVFDTKPYDRQALQQVSANQGIEWHFLEFRLTEDTASAARNARAVCVFVNDQLGRSCLELLATQGVELVALRCTGFNNVDTDAAKELKLTVTRVPIYSPHAVAEHAVALLLTLNRKIHRAFNRVRELNFSLNGLVGFDLHGKTAGIVGTGKIGQVTGQILRGFGMRVLAYDLFPNHEWAKQTGVEYSEAVSILGLVNQEGFILKRAGIPLAIYGLVAGLSGLIIT